MLNLQADFNDRGFALGPDSDFVALDFMPQGEDFYVPGAAESWHELFYSPDNPASSWTSSDASGTGGGHE